MMKVLKIIGKVISIPFTIALVPLLIMAILLRLITNTLSGDLNRYTESLKAQLSILRESYKCVIRNENFIICKVTYFAKKRNKPDAEFERSIIYENNINYNIDLGITAEQHYYDANKNIE